MLLDGSEDGLVHWKPAEIGGCRGGNEVYRAEGIELCVGDRIRWTRNDDGLCLINSQTAAVTTARYAHLARDSVKAAVERVSVSLADDLDSPPAVSAAM